MPIKTRRPDQTVKAGSILIYGKGGSGKTTMLGTMGGKGLLINTELSEAGDFVLANKADRIEVVDVLEWDEIDAIFWAVQKKEVQVDWVGVDSATGMEKLAKRKIVRNRPKVDKRLADTLTDTELEKMKISLPEYGQIGNMMEELTYRFNSLPVWKIWTAQERKSGGGDDDLGPITVGPDVITSSLRAMIPPMMLVGRISVSQSPETGEWVRTFRTGFHNTYTSKCRALPGKDMPGVTTTLNLSLILKYLLGDGKRPREFRENTSAFVLE